MYLHRNRTRLGGFLRSGVVSALLAGMLLTSAPGALAEDGQQVTESTIVAEDTAEPEAPAPEETAASVPAAPAPEVGAPEQPPPSVPEPVVADTDDPAPAEAVVQPADEPAAAQAATDPGPVTNALAAPFSPITAFNLDGNLEGPNDWGVPLRSGFYGPGTTPSGYPTTGIVTSTFGTDACTPTATDGTGYPGSQTQNTNPWVGGGASPNKKADLCSGGAAIEVVNVDGAYQYVFYAYWTRSPDASGDLTVFANLAGPLPGRADDKLVSFDYAPATSLATVTILSWNGTSWVQSAALPPTQFQYAVGRNLWPATGGNANASPATFAEIAVNLTTSGLLDDASCQTFTAESSISRTGNSRNAQLQDFIAYAAGLTIRSCGALTIQKATSPANTDGGPFGYSLTQRVLEPGSAVHDATLVGDADEPGEPDTDYTEVSGTLSTPSDTVDTWTGILGAPDYQLRETSLPDGWATKSIQCTYYDIFTAQTVTKEVYPDGVFEIPSGTLAPNGTSCVILNETSTITVAKTGAGDTTSSFGFSMIDRPDQTLQLGQSTGRIQYPPGSTPTITETQPTTGLPWVSYGVTCTRDDTGAVVASSPSGTVTPTTIGGVNITCTFVNQQLAQVRVSKNVEPDDASVTFPFTWSGVPGATTEQLGDGGQSGWYLVDPNTGTVPQDTTTGVYTVTETPDTNYNLAAITCTDTDSGGPDATATFQVSPGESVDCTFLNVTNGSITIIKNAEPDGPQDFDFTTSGGNGLPAGFALDDDPGDATLANSQTWTGLPSGPYTVVEQSVDGWTLTDLVCTETVTGAEVSTGDVATATATIHLDAQDSVVCTFTNARNSAQLTLTKEWIDSPSGDIVRLTATDAEMGVVANGSSTSVGPTSSTGTTTPATLTVYAGSTIDLSEVFIEGVDHYNTTLECTDPDGLTATSPLTGSYLVPDDPADVTCTFVNQARTATLRVVKSWGSSPVDGEEVTLSAAGVLESASAVDVNDGDVAAPGVVEIDVVVGRSARLAEAFGALIPPERFKTSLSCDGGSLDYSTGQLFGNVEILPADEGSIITCTFVNDRRSALVTMIKGWSYGLSGDQANLFIDGFNDGTGSSTVGTDPTQTGPEWFDPASAVQVRVYGGETVTLGETMPDSNDAEYTTQIVCRNELQAVVAAFPAGLKVITTILPDALTFTAADADNDGEVELTCFVTNARNAARLQLQKEWVDGIDGDTAELTVQSPPLVHPDTGLPYSESATATSTGAAGSQIAEPTPRTDPATGEPITGPFGNQLYENVAATRVFSGGKTYLNEELTSDITYLTEPPACTDASGADLTVAEYDATNAVAGIADQPLDYWVEIPKEAAGTITCTYSNEAPRGTITVVKSVEGADGTFQFNQTWDPADTDAATGGFALTTVGGTASRTWSGVLAGTYSVAELDPTATHDLTKLSCMSDQTGEALFTGLTATITLDDAESITCTFTNTQKSTIIVMKDAQPNDDQAFAFTTTTASTAPIPATLASFNLVNDADASVTSSTTGLVLAKHSYTITESATTGWSLDADTSVCTSTNANGDPVTFDVTASGAATVTPAPGKTVVCTYVNRVIPASLTLTKSATGIPADYGWEFEVQLTPHLESAKTVSGVGAATGTVSWDDLVINQTYTLTEIDDPAWSEGAISCDVADLDAATAGIQLTVTPGQEISCSVANALIPGELGLEKTATLSVDANGDGYGQAGDQVSWTFTVTNTGDAPVSGIRIDDPALVALGLAAPVCVPAALDPGETATCQAGPYTLTADDVATVPTLHNVATAKGTLTPPPNGGTPPEVVSPPDEADVPLAELVLEKTAILSDTNNDLVANEGEIVRWEFAVRNLGAAAVSDLTITDPLLGLLGVAITCDDDTVPPGGEVTCYSADYVVSAGDVERGSIRNIATASGTPDGGDGPTTSDPSESDTPTGPPPSLQLVKQAQLADTNGDGRGNPGETIVWTFLVTNPSSVTLVDITIDDPLLATLGLTVSCPAAELTAGSSMTCRSGAYTVTAADAAAGAIENVATATGSVPQPEDCVPDDDALLLTAALAVEPNCSGDQPPIESPPSTTRTTTGVPVVPMSNPVPVKSPKPLALTGIEIAGQAALAVLLLGAGAAALLVGRRNRRGQSS